jgi:hypothetical protein
MIYEVYVKFDSETIGPIKVSYLTLKKDLKTYLIVYQVKKSSIRTDIVTHPSGPVPILVLLRGFQE